MVSLLVQGVMLACANLLFATQVGGLQLCPMSVDKHSAWCLEITYFPGLSAIISATFAGLVMQLDVDLYTLCTYKGRLP
jgi:hypothetical protein